MRLSPTASRHHCAQCAISNPDSDWFDCSIPAAKKEHPMKIRLLVLFSGVLLIASFGHAQTATGETLMLDLPRQSQHAVVTQRIGITDITVNYHRPLAN